jgi:monoamine oxidase
MQGSINNVHTGCATDDHTNSQPGMRAILGTETSGPNARVATGITPEERLRWGLANVSKVFSEMAENFEGGTPIVWDQEAWSLGAAVYYAPGEMTTMFPHVASVEGRVHFAGEHTSTLFVMDSFVVRRAVCRRETASLSRQRMVLALSIRKSLDRVQPLTGSV